MFGSEIWNLATVEIERDTRGSGPIYNAVQIGKLQAAKLCGRRELRFLTEWIDAWLLETSTPALVNGKGARELTRP
jgi:hypothetical protein